MAGRQARAWQRMLSGRRLDLIDPSPLDIEIADIAHGLARVARWNGQTRGAEIFSVAQHCLLVEALVGVIAPEAGAPGLIFSLSPCAPGYRICPILSACKARVCGACPGG